jgi:uncharacterized protein YkwD
MLLALGPAVNVAAPSAEAYTPSPATTAAYQARLIQDINVIRSRYRRVGLDSRYCVPWFAARWAGYLAYTGAFYHQSMYPILRVCHATVAAENLARGNVGADRIVAAWMASPEHRANILDGRLTRIGVAARYARGQWVVVADFARF